MKAGTGKTIGLALGILLLLGVTAGASIYVADNMNEADANAPAPQRQVVSHQSPPPPTQTQQAACDDDNIVGKIVGGAAGGVAGSQIGKGTGKTAATIGGTVGGSLLGEEYLPTKNVTCR